MSQESPMSQQSPMGQQPAAAPVIYPGVAPRPPKPPLTPRARRGSWIAGTVSFGVLSLGWTLFAVATAVALVGGLVVWIGSLVRAGRPDNPGNRAFDEFLDSLDTGVWIPLLIAGGLVGLALMVLAFFLSRGILGAHGVAQPWAVTWAAVGIAVVASWLASSVLGVALQLVGAFTFSAEPTAVTTGFAVAGGIVGILLTLAIGLLSWWWMAHILRPAAEPPTGTGG